jgi:hypothetical protein
MPAWETPKPIIQQRRIRLLADSSGNKDPFWVKRRRIPVSNGVGANTGVTHIGLASREQVWSWFSEEILHALGKEEGEAKAEAHPSGCSMY